MTKLPSLSVFFPCFNEEKNVPIFLKQSLEILPQVARKFEVIVVDDGSQDKTLKVAKSWAAKDSRVKVVSHEKNKGYGATLKTGFASSRYDWVFFTDGDLQFSLEDLKDFVPHTEKYEVVIGYRNKRADGALRSTNALVYKTFIDLLFRLHVKDIDCAYKLLSKRVLNLVTLESDGAFTSAELLYKLKKKRIKFMQLAVNHYPRQFGSPSGNSFKVILKACKESLRLYLHMKFGLF
jgi:glycosyltransferase involved in cell wall biosynthesis